MKILVGFDGSEGSKKALKMARSLIYTCVVGEITVVHVQRKSPIKYASYEEVLDISDMDQTLKEVFDEAYKESQESIKYLENAKVELKIIKGDNPAQVLVDYAEDRAFDLIVVGARGASGLNKWRPGSVSKGIVDNCCTSVLVAK